MAADECNTGATIPEIALLAAQIGDAIGFSFDEVESPATSEHVNSDGAWEYHFETDDKWGFVAAGADGPIETTYPGWNSIDIEAGQWAVFYDGTFAGVVSPRGGRIGGYALLEYGDEIDDLESAMLDAFRAEHDAIVGTDTEQADLSGGDGSVDNDQTELPEESRSQLSTGGDDE